MERARFIHDSAIMPSTTVHGQGTRVSCKNIQFTTRLAACKSLTSRELTRITRGLIRVFVGSLGKLMFRTCKRSTLYYIYPPFWDLFVYLFIFGARGGFNGKILSGRLEIDLTHFPFKFLKFPSNCFLQSKYEKYLNSYSNVFKF